jgi:putative RecB family exonuclease
MTAQLFEKYFSMHAEGHKPEDIRAGGRATKEYPNKEDASWWLKHGPAMVDRWIDWRSNSGWHIWTTPDGQPAIELSLMPEMAGVPVKMGIDRVMVTPDGELVVLDIKSGARTPQSDLQLAFYAAGLELAYGIRPSYGTYWMARTGITSSFIDLNAMPTHKIVDMVKMFDTTRRLGLFTPNFKHCTLCPFTAICEWRKP